MSAADCVSHRSGKHKARYATKAEAKAKARFTNALAGGRPLRPYYCDNCDRWHIGHPRKAAR